MIPRNYIQSWKRYAPWKSAAQVEQDLIISRALSEIYNHPQLSKLLAFRGGTALFKFHLGPMRYSEDIDLVMVNEPGPIGPTMDALQERLNHWLGTPTRKRKEDRVTLIYKMYSEDSLPLKLKVEINTVEHFAVFGYEKHQFNIDSPWYSGKASVLTYNLDELLGTKLRALYQRKKGRDLFDLWCALTTKEPDPKSVVHCFLEYMNQGARRVTRAEFEANLHAKLQDADFNQDIKPLIADGHSLHFDQGHAAALVMSELLSLLPGKSAGLSFDNDIAQNAVLLRAPDR